MISPHIFRAYDIRGIYNKDFNLKDVDYIGKAYGTYLIRTNHNKKKTLRVCVGRDGRTHGEEIHATFMKGIASTGIQVISLGACFTPLVLFSICKGKFDGGVNITASHNPKEYNGFKLHGKNAHSICGDEIQKILKIIETKDYIIKEELHEIINESYWTHYIKKIKSISKHPLCSKIVIDAGNGITGQYAPYLFQHLGYKVIQLYCEVDGNFPNHMADPSEKKNLKDLREKVLENKAQFGIAFDGDGDRVGIIDSEGIIYDADKLIILLAKDVLIRNPGAKIVYTVTSTSLVKEEIERLGGNAIESKVGHSFVEKLMREKKALFGGESSGHMFFSEKYYGFDDALLAAVKILEIVHKSGISLKEHYYHLPKIFTSPEIKIPVNEENKFEIIEKVKKYFIKDYKCNTLDGVKIYFENKAWAICRASNTSSKISIRCEARDDKTLKDIMTKIELIIHKEIEKINIKNF